LMDEGVAVPEVAEQLEVKRDTLAKALPLTRFDPSLLIRIDPGADLTV